jgi:hypothetical protein
VTWPQLAGLAALGAFHGVNPAMGWLFAVARGMQERRRAALLWSLPAIAAGHAASVAIVASLVTATRSVVTSTIVTVTGGLLLVGFGLWQLLSQRHFRWAGMRLSLFQLAGWSFLMSSAHGAGLMLLPLLLTGPAPVTGGHAGHLAAAPIGALTGLVAAGVHTVAMFATATVLAVVVYEVIGLGVLRRAWFNLDRLWAGVLVAAGLATLISAT